MTNYAICYHSTRTATFDNTHSGAAHFPRMSTSSSSCTGQDCVFKPQFVKNGFCSHCDPHQSHARCHSRTTRTIRRTSTRTLSTTTRPPPAAGQPCLRTLAQSARLATWPNKPQSLVTSPKPSWMTVAAGAL